MAVQEAGGEGARQKHDGKEKWGMAKNSATLGPGNHTARLSLRRMWRQGPEGSMHCFYKGNRQRGTEHPRNHSKGLTSRDYPH